MSVNVGTSVEPHIAMISPTQTNILRHYIISDINALPSARTSHRIGKKERPSGIGPVRGMATSHTRPQPLSFRPNISLATLPSR
jgi:hypothetical protein